MRNYREHLILSGSSIKEALVRFDLLAIDAILFVVDENDRLIGSLTDGDVRRGLLKNMTLSHKVDEIIQSNPKYIEKGEADIGKIVRFRDNSYRIIPIIAQDKKVINVINFREIRSYLPLDTVIMAGGKGMRLRPLTENTPKPLLKIGDKSIIEHNLDRLRLYGIDDFWITLNYLGEQIEERLGDGNSRNVEINYIYENEPLGTIGSVSLIDNLGHDYVLLTNSDILTNLDYEHFFLEFINQDADFSVVTIPYKVNIPYAVLETKNDEVISFKEKPTYTYYSNGGIYLMKREVLNLLPPGKYFNATDLMEDLIKNGSKVVSYPLNGYWLDIGKHDDFNKAQKDIEHIKF